jgi:hypothetical protein
MASRHLSAIVALLLIAFAPVAWAQTTNDDTTTATPKKHKKKKPKPAPSDSASAAPADSAPPAEAAPAPSTPPEAAAPASAPAASAELPNNPPPAEERWDITDTHEDPNKRYLFLGVHYRGTIIPQAFENIFVNDGATIWSNAVGVELDIRKGGQSTIPWIEYDNYHTGNILFFQKGVADVPNNYSVVQSNLQAVYLGLDERWSVNLVPDKLDYEYGFGVGIGFVFGSLKNDWVYQSTNTTGPLKGSNGTIYSECLNQDQTPGGDFNPNTVQSCAAGNHTNSNGQAHVAGHTEPNWFNGGSVPALFPHISIVPVSLRYKPLKVLEMRFSIGLQLTGVMFNFGADYGLEQKPESDHKASLAPSPRDTL